MTETIRPPLVFAVAAAYVTLNFFFPGTQVEADFVLSGLLLAGLVVIGIPHGALDVWTYQQRKVNGLSTLQYIIAYLLAIAFVFGFWMAFPVMGLALFLALSAWHFGQADISMWGLRQGGWMWGTLALAMVLVWHTDEVMQIVGHMGIEQALQQKITAVAPSLQWIAVIGWFAAAARAIYLRNAHWLWTLGMLTFTPWIPLLLAFGMYFVGQHSFAGWWHLQNETHMRSTELWLKALPFSLGAWSLIALGVWFLTFGVNSDLQATSGAFFMLIGCISIPHIFESHWFLRNDAGE